eukprot:5808626-Pyramimonas_sp.AAC.1
MAGYPDGSPSWGCQGRTRGPRRRAASRPGATTACKGSGTSCQCASTRRPGAGEAAAPRQAQQQHD